MLLRTTTTTATFSRPFLLEEADRELPAGFYLVEAYEELLDGLSFPACRRVATFLRIQVNHGGSRRLEALSIEQRDLESASARGRAGATRHSGNNGSRPRRSTCSASHAETHEAERTPEENDRARAHRHGDLAQ